MEPPTKKLKSTATQASTTTPVLTQSQFPSSDEIITEKDLPLLANYDDVHVHHYLMKLSTDFSKRKVTGSVILFLEWVKPFDTERKIILDQCFLKINKIVSLKRVVDYDVLKHLSEFDSRSGNRKHFYRGTTTGVGETDWFDQDNTSSSEEDLLQFTQNKWSVTIQGLRETDSSAPAVIRIDYETLENSPSIHWRSCDGFSYNTETPKCCYTSGSAVNNRGLFPCQESPTAMATWEVLLVCEKGYTPLLSSDDPGEIVEEEENEEEGMHTHYFYCSIPLPMSTFAMVIGQTCLDKTLTVPRDACRAVQVRCKEDIKSVCCQNHSKYPCPFGDLSKNREMWIPVRLFCLDPSTVSILDLAKLSEFVFSSLSTSFHNFGPHPFSRQDIVIVPKSYPHEGLTSPSMIFISPSNFYGDEPGYISRLSHEFCHNWFGLLIGSLDWTEEWLSEGFATYCEDIVFDTVYQTYFPEKSKDEIEREKALKILMRFTSLQDELQNTETELHTISSISKSESKTSSGQAARNGLVAIKQFMHVHYYKGYLLLWHLTLLVGQSEFLEFLREYVWRYHGQLVTSEIFLECYRTKFKDCLLCIQDNGVVDVLKSLKEDWLYSTKLPPPYNTLDLLKESISEQSVPSLFAKAIKPLRKINLILERLINNSNVNLNLEKLSCLEILLLLELILNILPEASDQKRKVLRTIYFRHLATSQLFQNVDQCCNADLIHRWCELIILFKDESRLPVVKSFLQKNISMGVYLYGELMITEKFSFQNVAKQLYYELSGVYDLATTKILKEMLF